MDAGNGSRQRASAARAPNIEQLAKYVIITPEFLKDVQAAFSPGTTLIITDLPVSGQTHSRSGFKILTTD
jgi:hypothetical protein